VKLQDQPPTLFSTMVKFFVTMKKGNMPAPIGKDLGGTNLLVLQVPKLQLLHPHTIHVVRLQQDGWLNSTQQKLAKPKLFNSALIGWVILVIGQLLEK
jgi:hypothetical protein